MVYPNDEGEAKDNYPYSHLILKLKSNTLPKSLVDMLVKKSEALIRKLAQDEGGAKP
jgi:hypothetical protein